ncbi:LITAF-like zinc ribbon domain [Popillia japonica]|uniref:LITAF-like zinc ribbon domain n=1 Tax=Popillia japonica TaxID=7064 RepID=A0AAW1KJL7_POPJA
MEKPPHPPTYEEACSSQLQSPTVVEGTSSHAGRAPTVVLGPTIQFGPTTQSVICPHCQCQVLTKVEAETTTRTHLIAILLFACLCWLCACLPYCMDSCKNKNHYCPNCGAFLGAHTI